MFNRSRRNLACWFTLSMGSILVAFATSLYYFEVEEELESLDRLLYRKTSTMAASAKYWLDRDQWQADLKHVPLLGNNPPPLDGEVLYARWYNAEGQLIRFFGAPPPEQLTFTSEFQTIQTVGNPTWALNNAPWLRQLTLPVLQDGLVIGYVQVAASLAPAQETLNQLRLVLAIAVPLTLALIGLTGWVLGGLAMRPIRQAYEQLQRFTADASHELRAPLAAILSNAQVGVLAPTDSGEQHRRLQKIVDVAKTMSALVSNLLFLARHEGALDPQALRTLNLTTLLRELLDGYTTQAIAQPLHFTSQLPVVPIEVKADGDLLRQAIMNLINNACRYTPEGGKVQIRLFTKSHQAVIQVEDNGSGIPATDLPHIFERFYRVDKERSRETGGFGLGLAIVRQIVQAHRGHITVTSTVGQGSCFQITLPLKSP